MTQYTIFDFEPKKIAKNLLEIGQKVFKVSRAEVYPYIVDRDYTVEHHPGECFYTLKSPIWNNYNTTRDSEIGTKLFLSLNEAMEKAKEYEQSYRMWLSSSVCFKEAKCFESTRESDGHHLTMWYGLVPGPLGADSGLLVLKEHMTFIHAIDFGTEAKARKWLEQNFYPKIKEYGYEDCNTCEDIHVPNLYPCGEGSNWDYSADGYTGITDIGKEFFDGNLEDNAS